MDAELSVPQEPLCLIEGHLTDQETVIWVKCHDRHLQHITVINNDGEKLFYVEGSAKGFNSSSFRRALKDASGNSVFDLRRSQIDGWYVEDPDKKRIAKLKHIKYFTRAHTAIDATLGDSEVRVQMRPRDHMATTTYLNSGGSVIAEILLHVNNTPRRFNGDRDLSVFRVRAAKGADLSLVCFRRQLCVSKHLLIGFAVGRAHDACPS